MKEENLTTINYDSYHRPITFTLLLIVIIPAILCILFILIFFVSHWKLMMIKVLNHHAIFLLICVSFLYTIGDLPISMNYLRLGQHPYRSIRFCLWWYWLDYSLLSMSLFLVATASIQRHILVFNSLWLLLKRKRWILHYIPLIVSVVYPPLFYIVLMYMYRCEVYFNFDDGWCANPCYIDNKVLYNIDWLLNTITPVLIIILANSTLLIRVLRSMKRIRRQQAGAWKRQRKLTLQLFAFSSLYLVVWIPTTVVAILRTLALPNLYTEKPNIYYIFHMIYFVCPLQSFPCIFALPELIKFIRNKVKRLLRKPSIKFDQTIRQTTQAP